MSNLAELNDALGHDAEPSRPSAGLDEAEAILVESVPKLPSRHADTTRAVRFLAEFYERWNRAQPNPGRAARATGMAAAPRRVYRPSGNTPVRSVTFRSRTVCAANTIRP